MIRSASRAVWLMLALGGPAPLAWGQEGQDPAVIKGVQYLRGRITGLPAGEAALAGLAMVKAEVPPTDPGLAAALRTVLARFQGTAYTPQLAPPTGPSIYEASVTIMLLANLDPVAYRLHIDSAAQYILAAQMANGAWDYVQRSVGDTSITQYAVLGLWEAENAGTTIPYRVWDRAAAWYLRSQDGDGGWAYHRDEPQYRDTISMTAAGAGSLLICRTQLAAQKATNEDHSPLMIPLAGDARSPGSSKAETPGSSINAGINRGLAWIAPRFNPNAGELMGQSPYYGLYGIERIGALAERPTLGGGDWYERGRSFLLATQRGDGSWTAQHGEVPNTAWGVLFLTKSTAKSVRRIEIKRLGAGTLIGGRGLPKDLSSLTVAGGRVLARPMNGAVEGMLAVLEDPRSEDADAALSGLVNRYGAEGPEVLKPHLSRFRKLLRDRDPGIRSIAAWGVGRSGQLDQAPLLIAALEDPDEAVVAQARAGLQILSRKLDGYGPPTGASPAERRAAAAKWRSWYDSIRPPDALVEDDEPVPARAP